MSLLNLVHAFDLAIALVYVLLTSPYCLHLELETSDLHRILTHAHGLSNRLLSNTCDLVDGKVGCCRHLDISHTTDGTHRLYVKQNQYSSYQIDLP